MLPKIDMVNDILEQQQQNISIPHETEQPRVRKVSSVPNQEESTMCSLIMRKTPIVRFVRRQKPHEPSKE